MPDTQLPAPFLAVVDLRGLEYMPLFGNHLFGSEFNAAATDAEWRAAVTLWWAAWNQVPAGSLPPDDTALCRLADLGRDLKAWRKVKARALHGFTRCSDGRLYHEFICKQALVAWDKRVKERDRKAKWRADKDAKNAGQDSRGDGDERRDIPPLSLPMSHPQEQGRPVAVPAKGKGREGTGRDDKELTPMLPHDPPTNPNPRKPKTAKTQLPDDFAVSPRVRAWALDKGFANLDAHLDAFRRKAAANAYRYADWDAAFMEAIREDWGKLRGQNRNGSAPEAEQAKRWHETRDGVIARGCELMLREYDGIEPWANYRNHVVEEDAKRRREHA